jgi:hypothetical protein
MQPQPETFFIVIICPMPRVGEFCWSNVARLLLGVVIVVALVAAVGVWLYYSPGRGTPIEQPKTTQPDQ